MRAREKGYIAHHGKHTDREKGGSVRRAHVNPMTCCTVSCAGNGPKAQKTSTRSKWGGVGQTFVLQTRTHCG